MTSSLRSRLKRAKALIVSPVTLPFAIFAPELLKFGTFTAEMSLEFAVITRTDKASLSEKTLISTSPAIPIIFLNDHYESDLRKISLVTKVFF